MEDTIKMKYGEYMKFLDQEVKSDDRETAQGKNTLERNRLCLKDLPHDSYKWKVSVAIELILEEMKK